MTRRGDWRRQRVIERVGLRELNGNGDAGRHHGPQSQQQTLRYKRFPPYGSQLLRRRWVERAVTASPRQDPWRHHAHQNRREGALRPHSTVAKGDRSLAGTMSHAADRLKRVLLVADGLCSMLSA